MSAWMQAGMIAQTYVLAGAPIDLDSLAQGCKNNLAFGGDVRRVADCREEPMVLANQLGAKSLRYEIAVRLVGLKARHEAAGREVPMAEEAMGVLESMGEEGARAVVPVPGPCALHSRPGEPMPSDLVEWLATLWNTEDNLQALEFLAGASQFFTLANVDMRKAKNAVQMLGNANDVQFSAVLPQIYSASVLAASRRDHELADAIGDVVTRLASVASGEGDIQWAIRVLLQAAAAYEKEADWATWLEERSAGLATGLPSVPKTCLSTFLWCVEGIEPVLPVELWFHLRAKCIATAGAG